MVNVLAEQTREAQLEHIKALAARERAVAEFFTALSGIAQLCAPLVKYAGMLPDARRKANEELERQRYGAR